MSEPSAELQAAYDRREDLSSMTDDNDADISRLEDEEAEECEHKIADDRERAYDINQTMRREW